MELKVKAIGRIVNNIVMEYNDFSLITPLSSYQLE
jgi:hypothetical protein